MTKARYALILAAALAIPAAPALAADDVMIVYDASGSMWAQVDGVNKIVIAREVMADLLDTWPQDTKLGLIAYGHRTAGDCRDIETLIKPGAASRKQFIDTINSIQPKGKTPISGALRQAAEELSFRDTNATVVLISDGLETCHADPCAVASELAEKGVNFTAHVVGFDLDEKANKSLSCIASNTGGIFVPASNAQELKAALAQVQDVVEKVQAEPEPEPEPSPEPELPAVQISAPEEAIAGARFDVSWSSAINPRDLVTITPAGAKEGTLGDRIRVDKALKGTLTAPGETGMYEVRYVQNEDQATLASAPIEVLAAEMGVSAPGQVTIGARFEVSWSSAINPRDSVTITPAGAKEGTLGDRIRVDKALKGTLTAPAEIGMYEVRYVLNEDQTTLASAPIEVLAAEMGISAPGQVTTGARFEVSWSSTINPRDLVTITPAGAKEGTLGDRIRVDKALKGTLTAPVETGMYEARYILNEGQSTQASTPIEVVAAKQTIIGPDIVRAGAPMDVSWDTIINPRDLIGIAPAGAADKILEDRKRAEKRLKITLTAPKKPGLYEIRYVLNEGPIVLARHNVEVIAADAPLDFGASLKVPTQAAAGASIKVSWTGGSDSKDQRVALASLDQADFTWIDAQRVGESKALEFSMPDKPGDYEIRYLDVSKRAVLGRSIIKVQ